MKKGHEKSYTLNFYNCIFCKHTEAEICENSKDILNKPEAEILKEYNFARIKSLRKEYYLI